MIDYTQSFRCGIPKVVVTRESPETNEFLRQYRWMRGRGLVVTGTDHDPRSGVETWIFAPRSKIEALEGKRAISRLVSGEVVDAFPSDANGDEIAGCVSVRREDGQVTLVEIEKIEKIEKVQRCEGGDRADD